MIDERAAAPRRNVRQHNISLQESESLALRFLAETRGRNGNKSAIVGGLIAEHMTAEFGERWQLLVKDHYDKKESAK